ncbi:MAG: ABC transporter permease [Chloroflexi bacterium]|nr:MAG: ABC transporter permease [Chloroflexota bacterium]TMF79548.1 MAG: ABC transporter permease [Chloroflexota bacterium]TMF91548.1 MAG: ABC transporter permease [Chloroflexota bacterium]TMG46367.1 MAG: ABC transporter permease [Chloroflexota bacterium]
MSALGEQAVRTGPDLAGRRRREARRRQLNVIGGRVLVAVVILGGWELGARATVIDRFFWSQPSDIAATLWRWFTEGTDLGPLWLQVLVTMEETVGGFVVGSVFGVIFGVVLGRNRLLSDVLGPYIKGANAIPRVVVGALFAVSLGLDIKAKIATAAVLVFFVVFFNAFQGVREVDRNLIANARILGADDRRLTTEIIIPSALSWIVASLHTSFGLALVGAVVGELFGATEGIGELIYLSKNLFDTAGVFAGMALLAATALVAEALITALEDRLIRWRPPVATETRI